MPSPVSARLSASPLRKRPSSVEACKRHNVVAGIHNATAAYSLKMIAAGYRFVTLASDTRHLAMKAAEEVAAVRKGVGTGVVPAY